MERRPMLLLSVFLQVVRGENGYFWHVTDQHWDTTYWTDQRSCNDDVPKPGIYGDYWCDSNWRLVNDSINAMVHLKSDVDFILWTGDSVPHIGNQYQNETYVLHVLQTITDALKAAFPGVSVYPTMGNHDWYPDGQFPDNAHRLYNGTADIWKDWIVSPDQLQNFRRGAYYTLKTSQGLRILSLNTNVYYTADKLTSDLTDPVDQFVWMEDVLKEAREAVEKVLITAHVPPGIAEPRSVQWFQEKFHTRFKDILRSNSDIIVGMFCGHEHVDVFRHLKNHGGGPGIPIYMAPAVSPSGFKIPGYTGDPRNPAIRLFRYDRTSGLPLEYYQYYLNLTEANRLNSSSWELAYNTRDLYGLEDLSATSLNSLIKKMAGDGSVLEKYIRHVNVLAPVRDCGAICRAEYICSLDNLDYTSLNDCVTAMAAAATGRHASPLLVMVLVLFLFLIRY